MTINRVCVPFPFPMINAPAVSSSLRIWFLSTRESPFYVSRGGHEARMRWCIGGWRIFLSGNCCLSRQHGSWVAALATLLTRGKHHVKPTGEESHCVAATSSSLSLANILTWTFSHRRLITDKWTISSSLPATGCVYCVVEFNCGILIRETCNWSQIN